MEGLRGRHRGPLQGPHQGLDPLERTQLPELLQGDHGAVHPGRSSSPAPGPPRKPTPTAASWGPTWRTWTSTHWDTWLDQILAEAGPYLDVISHHCYKDTPSEVFRRLEGPSRPWEPPPVQQIIERRGQGGKPFWLTEVGWRSDRVGKDRQAGYLVSLLKGANQRRWISKVFIYELRDSPQEPGFGLLHYSGKPKPSYTAVTGYIRSMSAAHQPAHRLPPR